MTLGPLQLIAIEFDSLDRLRGRIMDEIDRLTPVESVRILDALFVARDDNGDLLALEASEVGEEELDEGLGFLIGQLLGFTFEGEDEIPAASAPVEDTSPAGLSPADIERIADGLAPGTGAVMLLVEHRWAGGLRDAIADAGGQVMAQGFLTPEGMLLLGAEAVAAAEALDAIETAVELEAIANVRALEAMATIELADEIEAAVVARTILTLVEAGFIEELAAEEAAAAVVDAALIEQAVAAGSTD